MNMHTIANPAFRIDLDFSMIFEKRGCLGFETTSFLGFVLLVIF